MRSSSPCIFKLTADTVCWRLSMRATKVFQADTIKSAISVCQKGIRNLNAKLIQRKVWLKSKRRAVDIH